MIEIGPNLAMVLKVSVVAVLCFIFGLIFIFKFLKDIHNRELGNLLDKIKEPPMYTYEKTITKEAQDNKGEKTND